ncbi:protein FAM243A [Coturnix japonica]|uniref:Chromosome 21 open reading frame 140 n=1 Tax=Coturnix japonica TaxID=93934 RepID=A0A8C2T6H8_COTJA|nr:protein FAM243A [Coturnix japonica]
MQRFVNPLLRHTITRGCFDDASKTQCLQYLRALKALQRDGFNTIFLGETDISESLITGEKIAEEGRLRWPVWTVVHAGSSQGWVPWNYKLLLRNELFSQNQNGVFQELCDSLTTCYGKCVIVTRDKRQLIALGAKSNKEQETGLLTSVPPVTYMSSIKCCPETARANGHELLSVPPSYTYLYPMDVAWSSLKWFIINNRKDFALRSVDYTHSYRCILFSDLIIKGIEKMTPNKWKIVINRVKKWENYYLDSLS